MFLRGKMSRALFHRVRTELKPAVKWTFILALPAVAMVLLAIFLLGGIHGRGGLPLMIAYAPFIALERVFRVHMAETPLNWFVVAVIEWTYLFLLILVFRLIFVKKIDG
jgi:hypothetical protein